MNSNLELFKAYQNDPTERNRNKIVENNFGLVHQVTNYYKNSTRETYDDLFQEGCVGLIRAVNKFDIYKGNAFSSFAVPYIRGEILHYLRDKTNTIKIPRAYDSILSKLRKHTVEETAKILNITVDEILAAKKFKLPIKPIHTKIGETNLTLEDVIPSPEDNNLSLELDILMSDLTNIERKTIERIYVEDMTQAEVAEQDGVSPISINRRKRKAFNKIRIRARV